MKKDKFKDISNLSKYSDTHSTLLLELISSITDYSSEESICKQFLERLSFNFELDKGAIYLKSINSNQFNYITGVGANKDSIELRKSSIFNQGYSILFNLKSSIIYSKIRESDVIDFPFLKDLNSALLLPITYKNEVLGFLFLGREKLVSFPEEDISLIEIVLSKLSDILKQRLLLNQLQVSQAKLTEAYENLKSFDNLKNSFLFNITHEFRTPLVTITGYAELLKSGDFGEMSAMQNKAIGTIFKNAKNLNHLIDNLLTFVSLSDKFTDLKLVSFDLFQFIKKYLFEKSFDTVEICVEKNVESCIIKSDKELFEIIFDQLISNAIKFNINNRPIVIKVNNQESSVVCSIIDRGIGIKDESQKKIFSNFYQGSQNMNRKYSGLGFGLSLVGKILKVLKYEVFVKSKVNEGTEIGFKIPLTKN